jgi:hypothetical protein
MKNLRFREVLLTETGSTINLYMESLRKNVIMLNLVKKKKKMLNQRREREIKLFCQIVNLKRLKEQGGEK